MKRLVPVLALVAVTAALGGATALKGFAMPGAATLRARNCVSSINNAARRFFNDALPLVQACSGNVFACDHRTILGPAVAEFAQSIKTACSDSVIDELPAVDSCATAAGEDSDAYAKCVVNFYRRGLRNIAGSQGGCLSGLCEGRAAFRLCQPSLSKLCSGGFNGCCNPQHACVFAIPGREPRNGFCADFSGSGAYSSPSRAFLVSNSGLLD